MARFPLSLSALYARLARPLARPCVLLLGLITLMGAWLRFTGLDFGLPNDSRPDESIPMLSTVLHHLLTPAMHGDWRFHPQTFYYPSLSYYLLSPVFLLYYWLGPFESWSQFLERHLWDPSPLHVLLRGVSALTGTLMIPAMALLARQVVAPCTPTASGPARLPIRHSDGLVLLIALLTATNYLLVRNSHFGTVDILLTLGVTLSLWAIVRYLKQPSDMRLYQASVLAGLTTGIKYPAALLVIPLWVSLFRLHVTTERINWAGFAHALWKPTGAMVLAFLLSSPWIMLDIARFVADLHYESHFFLQYRLPQLDTGWFFYPQFTLWHGMGGLLMAFFLLGVIIRWTSRKNRWQDAVLLSFLIAFFILLGFNTRVMTRYALPLLPVLLLYAGIGLWLAANGLSRMLAGGAHPWCHRTRIALAGVLILISLWQPVSLCLQFNHLLRQPDTRTLARQWILQHIPPFTPVATGPRLGQLVLPPQYGQLVTPNGPDRQQPGAPLEMNDISPQVRMITDYAQPSVLRQLGVRYVAVYEGTTLFDSRPWEVEALAREAHGIVYQVSPFKPRIAREHVGAYDPLDAFFLPFADFKAFERPGPVISIFDLGPPLPDKAPQEAGSTS